MKIELRYLALGLVALVGSLLASSQRISAYAAMDHLSAADAASASVLGTRGVPPDGASASPSNLAASTVYLPLVMRPLDTIAINGYLTQGGAPVGGISLELWLYDGSSYSATVATTSTNASGYYLFAAIPAAAGGQSYHVVYLNPEHNDSRLSSWGSDTITSSSVSLGTSDLANIVLVSPSPGVTVALPNTFYWTRRAATPTDSYFWILYDPDDYNPYASTYPLGYYSGVVINRLPTGFGAGIPYGWSAGVLDANGGTGYAYYYRTVTFSNSGASVSGPLNMAPQTTGRRDDLPLPPHPEE
jgi:hypothetical protein